MARRRRSVLKEIFTDYRLVKVGRQKFYVGRVKGSKNEIGVLPARAYRYLQRGDLKKAEAEIAAFNVANALSMKSLSMKILSAYERSAKKLKV